MLFLCDLFKEKNTKSAKSKRKFFVLCRKRRIIVTAVSVRAWSRKRASSVNIAESGHFNSRLDLFEVITALYSNCNWK